MEREYLADFGDQNGPRDTSKVAHSVGADASVLCPDLDHSQCLLEILRLFAGQFQDHQVVLSTNERSSTLFIFDGA